MPTYDVYGRPRPKKQVRFAPGTVSPPPGPPRRLRRSRSSETEKMKEPTAPAHKDTQPHAAPSSRDLHPKYNVRPEYLFPQHDPPPSPPPSPPRYVERLASVEHNIDQPRAPHVPTWDPHPAFIPEYYYPNQQPVYHYYPAYDPMMTFPPPPPQQQPSVQRQWSRAGALAEAAASFACAAALISAVQDPRIPPPVYDTLRFAGQQLRYAATTCR